MRPYSALTLSLTILATMLLLTCSSDKGTSPDNSDCEFSGITETNDFGTILSSDPTDWCFGARSGGLSTGKLLPTSYVLAPAFPNPAQTTTNITFGVVTKSQVQITVTGTQGEVQHFDRTYDAGFYKYTWDCSSVPPGMYCVRFQAGNFSCGGDILIYR